MIGPPEAVDAEGVVDGEEENVGSAIVEMFGLVIRSSSYSLDPLAMNDRFGLAHVRNDRSLLRPASGMYAGKVSTQGQFSMRMQKTSHSECAYEQY